jgi:hypothetical protein
LEPSDRRRPTVFRLGLVAILIVVVFGVCGLLASLAIMTGVAAILPQAVPSSTAPPAAFQTTPIPTYVTLTPALSGSETPGPTPAIFGAPDVGPAASGPQITGVPADIPMPLYIEAGAIIGRPDHFSFLTDLTYPETLVFYQQQLETREWIKEDYGTRIGNSGAELHYNKDGRRLTVRISGVPYVGTVVEISIRD